MTLVRSAQCNFCGISICLHRPIQVLLRFHERSKRLDRLNIKDIYVTWVMHLAVTGFMLCFFVFETNSAYLQRDTRTVSATAAVYSYDRSRIKRSDIFSRNIRSRTKSKRSRINRPGYFSCFFHYFGSYAHTSNVSGILSTRLVALALLQIAFLSPFPPFSLLISPLLWLFFCKLCSPEWSVSAPVYWSRVIFGNRKSHGCAYQRFIDSFNLKSQCASMFSKYAVCN